MSKEFCNLGDILTSRAPPLEMKGRMYGTCVRSSMVHERETRPLIVELKFERAEMQMIRWMCGVSMKDRRTNEELKRLVGVESITTVIISDRLRWNGHVMSKSDENLVKKCMEFRVEGKRPIGRPRRTWLEGSKRHSLKAVDLSQRIQKDVQIVFKTPPQQWGPNLPFWGKVGHADPLDCWRCSS